MVADRLAENQDHFRRANERLEALVGDRVPSGQTIPFLCECPDGACAEPIPLTLDEFASVRAHPRRFLVRSEHELEPGERVVERRDGYSIVEKTIRS